jgi:hypothetical protein
MTTQVYLVKALWKIANAIKKEDWMNGIKWFRFRRCALDAIEYEDIGKLMLIAKERIRQENL